MTLRKRISVLEAAKPGEDRPWHWLIKQPNQTQDEAIDAYGRDKIGPDDNLIIWQIVGTGGGGA